MKTSPTYRNWRIPLMLAAALLSAGCEHSQLPELRPQAVLLCAQPWGLFVVIEVALVATLVASVLASEFVSLLGQLLPLQALQLLLRKPITKRQADSGGVVLSRHEEQTNPFASNNPVSPNQR